MFFLTENAVLYPFCTGGIFHLTSYNTVGMFLYIFKRLQVILRGCMLLYMGESFQDYSCIQDFEDDFSEKVILKMLN